MTAIAGVKEAPWIVGAALLSIAGLGLANDNVAEATSSRSDMQALEVVLVTGDQPGPALWKVSAGDHVLWVLGEVSPLPAKVQWRSKQFENLLANSQEVLLQQSSNSMRPNKQQVAAATKAQKLPDGQTLKDVISPELHARVELARQSLGTRERIEKLRPFDAANRVWMSAMRSMDLKAYSAKFAVTELARKANVTVTTVSTPPQTFDEYLENIQHGPTVPAWSERLK